MPRFCLCRAAHIPQMKAAQWNDVAATPRVLRRERRQRIVMRKKARRRVAPAVALRAGRQRMLFVIHLLRRGYAADMREIF
jgi:hypothetical protein